MGSARDIILHIGLPKTATTALQRSLFRHDPAIAYIGKLGLYHGVSLDQLGAPRSRTADHAGEQLVRELQRCAASRWSEGSSVLVERVLRAVDEGGLGPGPLVLSHEDLLAGTFGAFRVIERRRGRTVIGVDPDALADRIAAFARSGWPGNVSIMVTLRRQDTFLASLFAQTFPARWDTSVNTLDRFVEAVTEEQYYSLGGLVLDYDWLVGRLEDSVGQGNVGVLFYEDIVSDVDRIAESLQTWFGTDPERVRAALTDRSWKTRTADQQRWRVQRYRGRNRVRHLGQWIKRRLHSEPDPKWAYLTEATRARVLTTYADSNRRLAQRLGRSLADYGYYTD